MLPESSKVVSVLEIWWQSHAIDHLAENHIESLFNGSQLFVSACDDFAAAFQPVLLCATQAFPGCFSSPAEAARQGSSRIAHFPALPCSLLAAAHCGLYSSGFCSHVGNMLQISLWNQEALNFFIVASAPRSHFPGTYAAANPLLNIKETPAISHSPRVAISLGAPSSRPCESSEGRGRAVRPARLQALRTSSTTNGNCRDTSSESNRNTRYPSRSSARLRRASAATRREW